jgi:hypothetical protein
MLRGPAPDSSEDKDEQQPERGHSPDHDPDRERVGPVVQLDCVTAGWDASLHHDGVEGDQGQGMAVDGGMPSGNVGQT